MKTLALLLCLLASPALACDVLFVTPPNVRPPVGGDISWRAVGGVKVKLHPKMVDQQPGLVDRALGRTMPKAPWCEDWDAVVAGIYQHLCGAVEPRFNPCLVGSCAVRIPGAFWDTKGDCYAQGDVFVRMPGDTLGFPAIVGGPLTEPAAPHQPPPLGK